MPVNMFEIVILPNNCFILLVAMDYGIQLPIDNNGMLTWTNHFLI